MGFFAIKCKDGYIYSMSIKEDIIDVVTCEDMKDALRFRSKECIYMMLFLREVSGDDYEIFDIAEL